jgi:S-adenosylhomocysteine hydrolase
MYYHESDTLLQDDPGLHEDVEKLDRFIHSLRPEEQSYLNMEIISDLLDIKKRRVEFIFNYYSIYGLLMCKKYLSCPETGSTIREIADIEFESLPLIELCDVCGIDHEFEKTDVVSCYSLKNFAKMKEDQTMKTEDITANQSFTEEDIHALSDSMPILTYFSNKIANRPFEGKRFILILHFLKDLIPFLESAEKIGLNPSETLLFYKEYQYPNKNKIITFLEQKGYLVSSLDSLNTVLLNFQEKCSHLEKPIIIIEDGGYLVPLLHNSEFDGLKSQTLGAVEQTTKGERQDLTVEELAFPVLSIAKSDLKNKFEPPHVANAVVINIRKLISQVNFNSKDALVIGYGAIGSEIANKLVDILSMNVTVFDIDKTKLIEAQQKGFKTCDYLEICVKEKFLIVGTTGETSIGRSELLSMYHNVYLVSASSDQREIGLDELKALSSRETQISADDAVIGTKFTIRSTDKAINLVADGYPINFWAKESMPNNVSDLIMSLIYLSAVEIAFNSKLLDKKVLTDRVNKIERQYSLAGLYREYYS